MKVPVVQPIDAALTADCQPAPYPEHINGDAIIDRLVSVEQCLAQLRGQVDKIRK